MTEPPSDSTSGSASASSPGDESTESANEVSHEIAYHLAWVLDDTPAELPESLVNNLQKIIRGVADRKDTTVRDLTVTASYIHLVVEPAPHYSPDHIATWFKNVSAKRFNQTHPENGTSITWADGYFVGTAGEDNRAAVRQYLEARLPEDTD